MSKKIIDWDELRAELLSDSEVQASFDAEERKERLREMLAQWRNHAGLTRAQWRSGWASAHRRYHEWKQILPGRVSIH